MANNNYKVFFTISFIYQIDIKKKVTKTFKSDLDINETIVNSKLNDNNVHLEWEKFALNVSLNDLNPPSKFIDDHAFQKKLITHRIVNLMNLTEVHLVQSS
jgi:hypothetical protein